MSDKKDKSLIEVLAVELRTWLNSLPDDIDDDGDDDDV